MALVAGTVTADPDGTPTGSGLALALYEGQWPAKEARVNAECDTVGSSSPDRASAIEYTATSLAEDCTGLAAALVPYIVAEMEIDGDPGHVT